LKALRELTDFMTVNETTDKNRQKLLRNLRVGCFWRLHWNGI